MSGPTIEELVAAYLDRRDREPELTPERFAAEHAAHADELHGAIERTLEAEALFAHVGRAAPGGVRTIGGYELAGELGRGGMGVVYRARRAADGGEVALKVLPMVAAFDPRALARFEREASILRRLQHDQIVAVREWGVHEETPYLVMDLVEGRSLAEFVGCVDAHGAAELVRDLARAVAAAHESGVLHRDIKPQNVIVRDDGVPVLLDFGLVSAGGEESLTSTGELLGTPRYMAPEQACGGAVDERTDVHALGLLLFELLAGRPVHDQDTRAAILRSVTRGAAPGLRPLRRSVPRDLARILGTALARARARRYPTALALADDLERFVRGAPVHGRPPGALVRAAEALRARPATTMAATAGMLLAVVLVWNALLPFVRAQARERRDEIERHVDAAVAAWATGDEAELAGSLAALFARESHHRLGRALERYQAGGAIEADDDPVLAAIARAVALRRDGRAGEACERLQAAIDDAPGSPWPPVLLARAALAARRPALAERELLAAIARMPRSVALAQELARFYAAEERHADAELAFRRALELDDDEPTMWTGLARSLLQLERDDEALAAIDRARELDGPLDRTVANTLAVLLDRAGQTERAIGILERLVEDFPDAPGYAYNLGFALDSAGRVAEARAHYERCLALSPGHPEASACLGWLLATAEGDGLHDEERAMEVFLAGIEHDRGGSWGLLNAAVVVARRTGRTARLGELLERLSDEGSVDEATVRLERARRMLAAPAGDGR